MWLAGEARPRQPDPVNVLSDKLVFRPRLCALRFAGLTQFRRRVAVETRDKFSVRSRIADPSGADGHEPKIAFSIERAAFEELTLRRNSEEPTNSRRARAGVHEVVTSVVGMRASGGGPGAGRPAGEHCTDEHRQQQRTQPARRSARPGIRAQSDDRPRPRTAVEPPGGCAGDQPGQSLL